MRGKSAITRRQMLSIGLGGGAAALAAPLAASAATEPPACNSASTPRQILGPFFPSRRREDEDFDLTMIAGRTVRAEGEIVHLSGQILDQECQPVEGALVEIWQANCHGRYDHERDARNPRPLDPNFQGWARMTTGADGRFAIKTVKPGSYPADNSGWIRPPHIHFKVSRRGYHELVTQMYFEGEELNEPDHLRRALSPEDRARVTVHFAAAPQIEPGARAGRFDITLRKA
jgi:protocatechuate 3,4-dioxygenase beta subunit